MANGKNGNGSSPYNVGEKIGELRGTQTAMLATLAAIQTELVRMNGESDNRHQQNVNAIAAGQNLATAAIEGHKIDDQRNFAELRKLCYMMIYSFIGGSFVVAAGWAVFSRFYK